MNQTVAIILLALLAVAVISFLINLYNKLVLLKFNVDKAYSNIDVVLKQRADEIPNLVSVAKSFMNHEKDILTRLTELRTVYNTTKDSDKKTELANETSKGLSSFFAVSENYPQLKSDALFKDLMSQLEGTENRITVARNRYIKAVQEYNVGIRTFPNNLTAMAFGYKEKPNFTVDNEKAISTAPKVDFNPAPSPTPSK